MALGVPDVSLSRENGRLTLAVGRATEPPVSLLDLLSLTPDVPPATAVLGLSADRRPVMLRFDERQVTHVLLSGASGAGKSALLRTIALSLALYNRQSQAQFLILDPLVDGRSPSFPYLQPLNYLPHLLTPICYQIEEAAQALQFLVNEMSRREEHTISQPVLIVFIDKAASLMQIGGAPISEAITCLLQRGDKTGIHLILSTRQPDASVFPRLLQATLPVRLAGRLGSQREAWAATGDAASGAEHLQGMGDFLAVIGQSRTYFQAAYVGDYDLHLCLQRLHRSPESILLARPYFHRPKIEPVAAEEKNPFNGRQMLFFDSSGKILPDKRI
jgi:DNA segregation ATPase FtsK/SpoIIIE-like protein